jgi:DNA (cytosine-5)-methyltransferase 1
MNTFYEFFAGGGMVRAGLGQEWRCLFANDFDHKKSRMYRENWGGIELKTVDVRLLSTTDMPGHANLIWASFPCQDLSLAGAGAGLKGERSGTFQPFWKLVKSLINEGRAPRLIALENVCGTLASHEGKDFATICDGFDDIDYSVGALVIDAIWFVPQSRPRLFIIGVHKDIDVPSVLIGDGVTAPWHNRALKIAYAKLPLKTQHNWLWWKLPTPALPTRSFSDIIEDEPCGVTWFSAEETQQLLSMMSKINRAKVAKAKKEGRRIVGGVYKRTRRDEYGRKVQRAEIRFDDVSGCLRTPAGGSSRQVILLVEGASVKARLISSRETARLMGLPDSYKLPENYNEAYHLTGDGVVVPVVRYLAEHLFEPILDCVKPQTVVAA